MKDFITELREATKKAKKERVAKVLQEFRMYLMEIAKSGSYGIYYEGDAKYSAEILSEAKRLGLKVRESEHTREVYFSWKED